MAFPSPGTRELSYLEPRSQSVPGPCPIVLQERLQVGRRHVSADTRA